MDQLLDIAKPWLNTALEYIPGNGEVEQLWFAVMVLGTVVSVFLLFSILKTFAFVMGIPKRRRAKRAALEQNTVLQQILQRSSASSSLNIKGADREMPQKAVARVQIFIDYANFDKNWVDNAYGLLAEGNQKVRIDWKKLTDIVMREVQGAVSSWQPDLVYAGTFVQASVLPERFTTPRGYKLPKTIAANYYIYAKDAELVHSKLDGKEYIAKKLHPAHSFLKYMMRKLPGYHVNISRRVIARNRDGSPVVMTSKSGIQYIKSGEKAVDSKVIADMTAGALNDGYDIAVLLGSDTDFLPVIETIQKGFNKPVVHFGFERGGHQVRSACWSHVVLDKKLVSEMRELPKVIPASVPVGSVNEPTAVSAVAAKLAISETQDPVKQVVKLFAPTEATKIPVKQDIVPMETANTGLEHVLSAKVDQKA